MFRFGVDYYPEHWPEERWPLDAQLMAEAGFNVVRLAEFAWAKMEPEDGRYDFDWLDRAIAVLAARGIDVVLGTPTASPPPWLMAQSEELFRVRDDGHRLTYGNRREYCPTNPLYHEHTRRIVTRMAEHYANHPSVIGWQIDNEFGDRCYCPICAKAFRAWLQRRYGTLDNLNRRWGTIFWSHTYSDWSQIPVPVTTGGSPNPGLALDFYRFSSDSYVAYQRLQLDILRRLCPRHFITHNLMGFRYDRLNYFDLASDLDFVSWDNYPRSYRNLQAKLDPSRAALEADTMRGLKGKNVWVMEQQAGSGGWELVGVPPRPGEIRLWAYQSIAHGADAIVFFRWRTALWGTEEYWHGMMYHDGRPSRRYVEIKGMGAELKRAGQTIAGATTRSPVAMILSYDSRFAFQIQANNPQFSYPDHFQQVYRSLLKRHVSVDIVSPLADLSAYRLVIAPALHVVTEPIAANLRRYVQSGGMLVFTPRSGAKDEANAIVNMPLPGLLADLCGAEVEEYDSLPAGVCQPLVFAVALPAQPSGNAAVWNDVLLPHGAEVVARFTQEHYADKPAITLNHFGRGRTVYVGTFGDDPLWDTLSAWLLHAAAIQPLLAAAPEIEVAERWQGDRRLLFVLNHDTESRQALLNKSYVNVLNGTTIPAGPVMVAPRDVLVLVEA